MKANILNSAPFHSWSHVFDPVTRAILVRSDIAGTEVLDVFVDHRFLMAIGDEILKKVSSK